MSRSFPSVRLSSFAPLAAVVLAASVLAGCAAEPQDDVIGAAASTAGGSAVVVAPGVVSVDLTTSKAATVTETRIELPLTLARQYEGLAPGTIFVGGRGTADGKNPDGFLRRVQAVHVEGSALVIDTTAASLTDAIITGNLAATNGASSTLDDDETASARTTNASIHDIHVDFANEPLFSNVDSITAGGKTAEFDEAIILKSATLAATPMVNVDLRIRDGKVQRFLAKVEGNFDTSVSAIATVTAKGDVTDATRAALKATPHHVERVIYKSNKIPLPTIAIGTVPVSPSVAFTVTLRCDLAFGGEISARAGVDTAAHVRLGALFEDGAWAPPIQSDFDVKPTFAMDYGHAANAKCAIGMDAELSAYGLGGVTLGVAPYVEFAVTAAGNAAKWHVGAGASGTMSGRADVFGVRAEDLDRSLVDWTSKTPIDGSATAR